MEPNAIETSRRQYRHLALALLGVWLVFDGWKEFTPVPGGLIVITPTRRMTRMASLRQMREPWNYVLPFWTSGFK